MPTQLIQLPGASSGTATLRLRGVPIDDPAAVEIAIIQFLGDEKYLDPRNPDAPWSPSAYWFRPLLPRLESGEALFDLEYGVTYHLRANQPYKLMLRSPDSAVTEERFVCPANQRRPTTKPEGWQPPPAPRGVLQAPAGSRPEPDPSPPASAPAPEPVPAPEPAPSPEPVSPLPAPVPAVPEPVPPAPPPQDASELQAAALELRRKRLRQRYLLIGTGLVLIAVFAGISLWLGKPQVPAVISPPAVEQAQLDSLEAVRKYLAGKPPAADAAAKVAQLASARKLLDGQFLLLRYAAEQGDIAAARDIGRMYDPATFSKDSSPLPEPNPVEAARWLKQAAQKGDAEAQYRFAMLLKRGGTDEENAPEQAVFWMRKAAEQGHELARKESLP
ncbi:MAG: sel1 repeat family protein [Burkholderiaceae bacterium]|jgi:hypothetical protein|nr:sel1 repeat family protein [Burkholderiaceae bacterium]